jgi:hypothetical protein
MSFASGRINSNEEIDASPLLAVSLNSTEDTPVSQPGMWLEIRRGKTNFPLRPISGDRFLIGAGSNCHLQLGGEHVPMLHSLLGIEGKTASLEAVVAEPPLLVNGEARRQVELTDEDTVTIGDFEFVFHRLLCNEPESQVAVTESSVPIAAEQLAKFSATELVALIEDEVANLDDYDNRRELGAAALLDAAHRLGEGTHPAIVPMATFRLTEPTVLKIDPLNAPAPVPTDRESEFLLRAKQLQDAQQQLALQLAELTQQIADWQAVEARASHRFSA